MGRKAGATGTDDACLAYLLENVAHLLPFPLRRVRLIGSCSAKEVTRPGSTEPASHRPLLEQGAGFVYRLLEVTGHFLSGAPSIARSNIRQKRPRFAVVRPAGRCWCFFG